jgi:hypothetical protein
MLRIFFKLIYYVMAPVWLKGIARTLGKIKVFYVISCLIAWFVTRKFWLKREIRIRA